MKDLETENKKLKREVESLIILLDLHHKLRFHLDITGVFRYFGYLRKETIKALNL